MNPTSVTSTESAPTHGTAAVVRHAVQTLNELDAATADHLAALAFVLTRVARADGRVCGDERSRMEAILVDNAGIAPEHAVLVTEIACHRAELADCGSAYIISRGLRTSLEPSRRESIIHLLAAVADADGCFAKVEAREIAQIAGEIGIDVNELPDWA